MSCADKPAHQCLSTVHNEEERGGRRGGTSGFFACHRFMFPHNPTSPTCAFSLIRVQRREPAELTETPQSAPLKQDAITSQACQDDLTIQSVLCSGLSARSRFDKNLQPDQWRRENNTLYLASRELISRLMTNLM